MTRVALEAGAKRTFAIAVDWRPFRRAARAMRKLSVIATMLSVMTAAAMSANAELSVSHSLVIAPMTTITKATSAIVRARSRLRSAQSVRRARISMPSESGTRVIRNTRAAIPIIEISSLLSRASN